MAKPGLGTSLLKVTMKVIKRRRWRQFRKSHEQDQRVDDPVFTERSVGPGSNACPLFC
jgi:hypothetical protein